MKHLIMLFLIFSFSLSYSQIIYKGGSIGYGNNGIVSYQSSDTLACDSTLQCDQVLNCNTIISMHFEMDIHEVDYIDDYFKREENLMA